jgi:hypothetical protein
MDGVRGAGTGTGTGTDTSTRKRDYLLQLIPGSFRSRSSSSHRPSKNPGPISTPPGLDQHSIKLLSNPTLLETQQISMRPDLEEEKNRLKESTKSLQKALPDKSKLRWSVVDKDKFGSLIRQLKEYNELLNRILPVSPESPQRKDLFYTLFIRVPELKFIKGRRNLSQVLS